jgi:hypothetical protein
MVPSYWIRRLCVDNERLDEHDGVAEGKVKSTEIA